MTKENEKSRILALLPLRDIIVFPHMVAPLYVGRQRSIAALEEAMAGPREILLVAQKDSRTNRPRVDDLFDVGTICHIKQLLRLPDDTVKILVEGRHRGRIVCFKEEESFFSAEVEAMIDVLGDSSETDALIRSLKSTFETFVKLNKRIPTELISSLQSLADPAGVIDTVAAHLTLKLDQRQEILEIASLRERLEKTYELLQSEIEILQVEKRIRSRVKRQIERNEKEYYLNEQMHAIQRELGERDEFKGEILELEERIRDKEMSDEAHQRLKREVRKLKMMAPMSAEATVVRNYIDWVLSLPWYLRTEDQQDLLRAEAVLDEDHYGLAKVKERILEYLAVQSLVPKMKGPILCLVGPPGVGKTSLGRSIARAIGRRFVRLSLGGVRDEAEIRGHRRTYIGALPGKIVQNLRKAGSNNPVFLFDEVDKMSTDFRGDPSSALLEVLDPEQNDTFNDHYLELDYDLSDAMFITTANNLHGIPVPLQDRMEVIQIPGYTDEEKLEIAKRHLVPKQLKANGLEHKPVAISGNAILSMVSRYTKEAGVRSLERELASVCRKIARKVVSGEEAKTYKVSATNLSSYLGVEKFTHGAKAETDQVGMVNGLAVTMHGGDLLATEVTVVPGKGKLLLTGKLGDVMQESARAALSYVRSRSVSLGLDPDFHSKVDIHVHCPEGAIPKDGPSAGITMATALVSALLHIPVRRDIAMTGEITLRGRVLAIGGLKEKLLAARRAKIAMVIIPEENLKDLKDVPASVLKSVEVVAFSSVDDVLKLALCSRSADGFLSKPSEIVDWRHHEIH